MIDFDNFFYVIFTTFLLTSFIIYVFNKNNILIDQVSYSAHKKLKEQYLKSPSLCGGIIIYICSILFFKDLSLLILFSFFILVIGLLSDTNKMSSPGKRIFFQFIVCLGFIVLTDLGIKDLRIETLNYLFNFKIISILFTIFCILILINGSNFLDGLNTLVIGYYSLVCFFLILLSYDFNLLINSNIKLLFIFLIVLFPFNFFGKIYLGDSGSYLVAFFISFFVIDFSLKNSLVSPYLICFLLWYPAFENLFSIIRRLLSNNKADVADQHHLHQMIYNYFIKKKIINNKYINTLVANLINIYNLIIFISFYKLYSNTKILIFVTITNIVIYLVLYFLMKKKLFLNINFKK
jgi:UDP-N-acetylmuramyl pentapeptide phosphotransferase/UDP-N-acetylglucosamine-1-phosphate transferase